MGAGKSSIGRKVARSLQVPFTDTDSVVVREHGPIPELFAAHGEAHFRRLERDAVVASIASGGVVALGGGAVLHADTRRDLQSVPVVLLSVEPRVVAGRIAAGGRPLLDGEDPMKRWQRIRDERWPLYQEVADVEFDTSRGRIAQVVADIVDWLEKRER